MSWTSILKRIFKEEKDNSKAEREIETVTFEQLPLTLNSKLKWHSERKDNIKKEITERIDKFSLDMQEAITVIEKIDLSKRKEHEKIKTIVEENLRSYTAHLNRLVERLNNLENMEIKGYLNKMPLILNEFDRTSHSAFEKSTILIGNELQETRVLISEFFKDVNSIAKKSKPILEESELINKLDFLFGELKQNDLLLETLHLNQKESHRNLEIKELEYEKTNENISRIKISIDYKKDQEEKDKHKRMAVELDKKIQSAKDNINLKLLAKFFHENKKKDSIIKDYIANFKSALENDKNLEIASLVMEAQDLDVKYLGEIQEKISELSKPLLLKTDNKIIDLENNLKKLDSEIAGIKNYVEEGLKKKEKLTRKREKIEAEIKDLAVLCNLKIE